MLKKAFIPYKAYYSSPFCRWQGSLSNENSIVLGGNSSKRWLASRDWDPRMFDYLILAMTISQNHQFFAASWAAAIMGAKQTPAVTVSQACTTSTTAIFHAAMGVETGLYKKCYVLMADRGSNSPHTVWPNPMNPGGEVESENWMSDNFNSDPNVGLRMVETAENVARESGFTKEQCDDLTYRRYEQYHDAIANGRSFQRRYMFPVEVRVTKKETKLVEEDEGVTPTTREGLARLKPVVPGGVVSFGAQTHPADGNCSVVVTTKERAEELSPDRAVTIQVISYGFARAKAGFMPAAPVPAARMALENAGLKIQDIRTIKTHNPFIVNDLYFAQEMGIDPKGFNNYGSTIVFGHPNGATGGRLIIEGIEETVLSGGGYLLWAGCAAGDTGGSIILKIG